MLSQREKKYADFHSLQKNFHFKTENFFGQQIIQKVHLSLILDNKKKKLK